MGRILFILIFSTIFATGCGSSNVAIQETQNNTQESDDSNTIIYENLERTVEVPQNPERIVAVNYFGDLAVLGLNIVGSDLTYTSTAWEDSGYLEDVVDVGQSVEAVAALEPDLIVTYYNEQLPQYETIAPTIYIPYGTYEPDELISELGKATGREQEANSWIEQFDESCEDLKNYVPDLTETYSILDVWGGEGYLYGEHFGRAGYIIYNKLGLKGPDIAEETYINIPDSYLPLTVEAMPEYIGDVLLLMYDFENPDSISEYTNNVVYKNLDAVLNNNVYEFNASDFQYADPISLDYQVEILRETFNEKVE